MQEINNELNNVRVPFKFVRLVNNIEHDENSSKKILNPEEIKSLFVSFCKKEVLPFIVDKEGPLATYLAIDELPLSETLGYNPTRQIINFFYEHNNDEYAAELNEQFKKWEECEPNYMETEFYLIFSDINIASCRGTSNYFVTIFPKILMNNEKYRNNDFVDYGLLKRNGLTIGDIRPEIRKNIDLHHCSIDWKKFTIDNIGSDKGPTSGFDPNKSIYIYKLESYSQTEIINNLFEDNDSLKKRKNESNNNDNYDDDDGDDDKNLLQFTNYPHNAIKYDGNSSYQNDRFDDTDGGNSSNNHNNFGSTKKAGRKIKKYKIARIDSDSTQTTRNLIDISPSIQHDYKLTTDTQITTTDDMILSPTEVSFLITEVHNMSEELYDHNKS